MSDNITIRTFEPRDKSAVIELWGTVFPDDPVWNKPEDVIRRKMNLQGDLSLVCIAGNQLAGTVLAGFDGVRGWGGVQTLKLSHFMKERVIPLKIGLVWEKISKKHPPGRSLC